MTQDLITRIASEENLSESFDYVVGHMENARQREGLRRRKGRMLAKLRRALSDGSFRLGKVRDMKVMEGRKERDVQVPTAFDRVACHAVMVVVESLIAPTFIRNTGAAIKGRGTHWLFHETERITRAYRPEELYFYKCDIRKYYDNIDQRIMMEKVRGIITDEAALSYLEDFVALLPKGLSKGLRSSQILANLYLSEIDHEMERAAPVLRTTDGEGLSAYFRYMDDVVVLSTDKRELWRIRDMYHGLCSALGLEIKPDECVRPLTEGLDFLGYVNHGSHVRLRKHIKKRFARHMRKVRSRTRRIELTGSFKGMACHADARHLFKTLTGQKMIKFSSLNVAYRPADGKKRFQVARHRLASLQNKTIEVHDFETDVTTSQGEGRCVVSFRDRMTGEWGKFFTASEEMIDILRQVREQGQLPFETVIRSQTFDGNKIKYSFT